MSKQRTTLVTRLRPTSVPRLALLTQGLTNMGLLKRSLETVAYLIELGWVPRPIKWVLAVLFLIQFKSWPLVWHLRMFYSITSLRVRAALRRRLTGHEQLTHYSPVGKDVFEVISVFKTKATLDDCDWNGHLSNSSYAKNADYARMNAVADFWFPFFPDGGWMALGGGYYNYIREIPMGADYEIWLSIGGWDEKWLYLITHFVSYPRNKPKSTATNGANGVKPNGAASNGHVANGHPLSKPLLPANYHDSVSIRSLPPGAIVHCIAVSQYCFKHGRVTVPPYVVLPSLGFNATPEKWGRFLRMRGMERDPSYPKVKVGTVITKQGKDRMKLFHRGGWKEEGDWWRLPEEVERRNQDRAEWLGRLREAMMGWGSERI